MIQLSQQCPLFLCPFNSRLGGQVFIGYKVYSLSLHLFCRMHLPLKT
jgi:hypothetical protein